MKDEIARFASTDMSFRYGLGEDGKLLFSASGDIGKLSSDEMEDFASVAKVLIRHVWRDRQDELKALGEKTK